MKYVKKIIDKAKFRFFGDSQPGGPIFKSPVIQPIDPIYPFDPIPVPKPVEPKPSDK